MLQTKLHINLIAIDLFIISANFLRLHSLQISSSDLEILIFLHKTLFSDFLLVFNIPIITVAMYSGRTQRDKDRLAEAITEDVMNILKVEKKDVIIIFQEASPGNWYVSGIRL
jgi:4-oxalocrotonate tautomerase